MSLAGRESSSPGGSAKIPIGGYECIEIECAIEPAGVGQDPDFSTAKANRLWSPVDRFLSKDGCEGRLPEKSQIARGVTYDLSFQFLSCSVKFMIRKLAGSYGRPFHCGRQAAPVFKNCAVVFRLNHVWRKASQVKDAPKSVAAT